MLGHGALRDTHTQLNLAIGREQSKLSIRLGCQQHALRDLACKLRLLEICQEDDSFSDKLVWFIVANKARYGLTGSKAPQVNENPVQFLGSLDSFHARDVSDSNV